MHSENIFSMFSWELREPAVPQSGLGGGVVQKSGPDGGMGAVGVQRGEPGFCPWGVSGGEQGGLPGAGGIGWLLPGQTDVSSIVWQYPPLCFHLLHQVDPGVVLGKLKYLPRSTHEHSSASQDNPETTQHH